MYFAGASVLDFRIDVALVPEEYILAVAGRLRKSILVSK